MAIINFDKTLEYGMGKPLLRKGARPLRYWKHRRFLRQLATREFPHGTRYEILMTVPEDFGRTNMILLYRDPELDTINEWATFDFPSIKDQPTRFNVDRGVYVLARQEA